MRAKFSLRLSMILIAIGACFPSMLGGILGLSSYDGYKIQEKKYKDALPDLRQRVGVANFVTEVERAGELAAENARRSRDAFNNARGLVGLGLILGGLAVILRLWQWPGIITRSCPPYHIYSACSTLALILLTSFALAGALYIIIKILVNSILYMSSIYDGI